MPEINYKNKYMALRAKYMEDMDMAFRLGMEQGVQQAQQEQMAQQQAEAQAMQQAAAAGMGGDPNQPGQPGEQPPGQPGAQPQPGQDPMAGQPTELDQHISQLEGMLGGSKPAGDPEAQKNLDNIKKSLDSIKALRKAELQAIQFKKGEQAINGIVKALHKPAFKLGVQATHNLSNSAKAAVSMQHKIVNDVMAKMEEEEKKASKSIKDILSVEGLTKG